MTTCPKCGLPKELCVCEKIAKEQQKIKIYVEEKHFRKKMTIIEGIGGGVDIKRLATLLKSKLACGGTIKEGKIGLQGDHRNRVREILKSEGFSENAIEVR